jgi:hypothetical protein
MSDSSAAAGQLLAALHKLAARSVDGSDGGGATAAAIDALLQV